MFHTRVTLIPLLALLTGVLLAALPATAGSWSETRIDDRRVLTYAPHALDTRPAPLLIALHSEWDTIKTFQRALPIEALADRYRFRVALLEGTDTRIRVAEDRHWNAGACCGDPAAEGIDDVAFLDHVIQTATSAEVARPSEIFLFGHSNGAMLAYLYACTYPDRIKGVVGVSGSLAVGTCPSAEGVKVLHIHGLDDQIVPVAGGPGVNSDPFDHRSTDDSLNDLYHAGADVEIIRLPAARHNIFDVSRHLEADFEMSLAETLADFIETHRLSH